MSDVFFFFGRAFQRYVQWTVAMDLATVRHHSYHKVAKPGVPAATQTATYAAPSPVAVYIVPAPAAFEYVALAPVDKYIAPAPADVPVAENVAPAGKSSHQTRACDQRFAWLISYMHRQCLSCGTYGSRVQIGIISRLGFRW